MVERTILQLREFISNEKGSCMLTILYKFSYSLKTQMQKVGKDELNK